MLLIKPRLDSINELVDKQVDSILSQIQPTIDSINHAYGGTEDNSMNFNFEIDNIKKIIMFYEKSEPEEIHYYQEIEPFGGARKYVISDSESFIFYGNVDSVLNNLGVNTKTLYK